VKVRRILVALAAVCAALGLVACSVGGDDDDEAGSSTTETQAGQVDTSTKPTVEVPEGPPPAGLQVFDVKEGFGVTAETGDKVKVQYVGVSYSNGRQFDASWDRREPFTFTLGAGNVIPGWDQGLVGMKVGGRRRLTIPPELAYGAQGQPPDIGRNETLIFVIDLLEVG
jgi:peptidylprolyl isomerase